MNHSCGFASRATVATEMNLRQAYPCAQQDCGLAPVAPPETSHTSVIKRGAVPKLSDWSFVWAALPRAGPLYMSDVAQDVPRSGFNAAIFPIRLPIFMGKPTRSK